jgi:dextranase
MFLTACSKNEDTDPGLEEIVEYITTDKCRYLPGEEVHIDIQLNSRNFETARVRFNHMNETIESKNFKPTELVSLTWKPPTEDFKGYSVQIEFIRNDQIIGYASTALDVSSDWTRFPRYGFLSKFPEMSAENIEAIVSDLNTFHINGLQYYDWHNKHHIPLPLDNGSPEQNWKDIAKRDISFQTVSGYIKQAKDYNMASMSYNLLYGTWKSYLLDGVSEDWMIYNDPNHGTVNKHDLDNSWALSDIYLANPANEEWQTYIFDNTADVYRHLEFDGWHLDQLGHRGDVYDYNGKPVDLWNTFPPFLKNLRSRFPDKKMVLNAVNQYGQKEILSAPVDFAYTELWPPNDEYTDLADVIIDNSQFNENTNTVLAAYMNYDLADSRGSFNEPAVLLTDAVIMAFGGAHLELGEHMLGKEYFPNDNLDMPRNLKTRLIEYYDFLVAYQNLLRDGGKFSFWSGISSQDINITNWSSTTESVVSFKKEVGNLTVYHLINFDGINSTQWRDQKGTQVPPRLKENFSLSIPNGEVKKVIYSSPDWHDGVQLELDFTVVGASCEVIIPFLEYWGMIILE